MYYTYNYPDVSCLESDIIDYCLDRSRKLTEAEALAEIQATYMRVFHTKVIPLPVQDEFSFFMRKCDPFMIVNAIEDSANIPRPAWAYSRKILMYCLAEGVTTQAAYLERNLKFQARKQNLNKY